MRLMCVSVVDAVIRWEARQMGNQIICHRVNMDSRRRINSLSSIHSSNHISSSMGNLPIHSSSSMGNHMHRVHKVDISRSR